MEPSSQLLHVDISVHALIQTDGSDVSEEHIVTLGCTCQDLLVVVHIHACDGTALNVS